jgi:phosphoglycerol transferase
MVRKLVAAVRYRPAIDLLITALLVPVGTLVAMWFRGVSYRDLSLLQMSGDGVISYVIAGHFETSNALMMQEIAFPDGLSIFAWPPNDFVLFVLTVGLTKLSGSGIIATNAIFFLGFGLSLASGYWVIARLSQNRFLAVFVALNYAFLPEHWKRQSHLALSLYWLLPFMVYVVIRLVQGQFLVPMASCRKSESSLVNSSAKKLGIYLLVALVFATNGVYFGFFLVLLLLSALSYHHLSEGRLRSWNNLHIFSSVFILVFAAVTFMSGWLSQRAGTNLKIFQRNPLESVLYGGQLRTLAMPWGGTELPFAARPTITIASLLAPNENEFWQSTLGAIAFWLVIALIAILSTRGSEKLRLQPEIVFLVFSSFVLMLFFFSGGLGYYFALIEPQIRAWNRLSLLLSFTTLAVLALCVKRLSERVRGLSKAVRISLSVLLVLVSIWFVRRDLLPANLRLDLSGYRALTTELTQFGSSLDHALPENCAVFQLPAALYPEVPPVNQLAVYELFLPSLFTGNVRYSYGQMKPDEWWLLKPLPSPRTSTELRSLRELGYCGVLIDTLGLEEADLESTQESYSSQGLLRLDSSSGRWRLFKFLPDSN